MALADLAGLRQRRFQLPRIIMTGNREALIAITRTTHNIALSDLPVKNLTCGYDLHTFTSASLATLVEAAKQDTFEPLALSAAGASGTLIDVPIAFQAALRRTSTGQGIIRCRFVRELAGAPTFTDRSLTIHGRNGSGLLLFDVSALENIDNVRFSGGIALPPLGERTRLLDPDDSVVSVEWVDVTAAERRDVILVTIGALAAIAAAMAIEAIRPFIDRE